MANEPKFRIWITKQTAPEMPTLSMDGYLAARMNGEFYQKEISEDDIRVEIRIDGKWVEE